MGASNMGDGAIKKICSECKEEKDFSEFSKDKRNKDGFVSKCKQCVKKYSKIYYEKNKVRIIERQRIYYADNNDKISVRSKSYYEKNKEIVNKRNKNYRVKNKDKELERCRRYRLNNKKKISKLCKQYRLNNKISISFKRRKYRISEAYYNPHYEKLTIDEAPRAHSNGKYLEVVCRYCGKYFIPTNLQVQNRIAALSGNLGGSHFLYCSDFCKKACPVYGQVKYPKGFKKATAREVQYQLRQMVLKRDNWTCQKCNKTTEEAELHCHHKLPLNESPVESADVSNCVTLCKECHKEAHRLPGCNNYELKCESEI